MLFNSISFLVFFPLVVLVYFIVPKKLRCTWLLIASYYFYMSWNARYALLIAASTLLTYIGAIIIGKSQKNAYKKAALISCILINLGILLFFKYFTFLLDNLNLLLSGTGIVLNNSFDIILPVGISFYTFQALGYIIDVYRGDVKVEYNLIRYALFVSFFPQLVAGPIERSKNLLAQIDETVNIKAFNLDRIVRGLITMLWGFFLKMVIADRIAICVDTVYGNYNAFGSLEIIAATVAFAIQIYCDFSSYSIIAVGAANVMGFTLMDNFKTPYFSTSIKEFWRRWHISLSQWFRDYLYIPLGGSRCSRLRKWFNLMVTFFCSGLWHGANWTFVIWGCLHGIYQIIGEIISPLKAKLRNVFSVDTENFGYKFIQIFITFVLTDFAWLFFRADSLGDAINMIQRIFTAWEPGALLGGALCTMGLDYAEISILCIALSTLLCVDLIQYKKDIKFDTFIMQQNIVFRWCVLWYLMIMILVFGIYGQGYNAQTFIYFQF